jgi:hypothetical protein
VRAFPGLLRVMDLHAVPMGDKSVSMVYLPFAALALLFGFKLIRSALASGSRKS